MADPWSKIWWTWYTSRSHAELGGVALALGPLMMLLIKGGVSARHRDGHTPRHGDVPRDVTDFDPSDAVCARTKSGRPVTLASIARDVRFPVSQVEAAMQELFDAGTAYVSVDGAYGFFKFWTYQESESAQRTRKYRGRHSDGHSDNDSDVAGDGHRDRKTLEVRGEREEDRGKNSERETARAPACARTREEQETDQVFKLSVREGIVARYAVKLDQDADEKQLAEHVPIVARKVSAMAVRRGVQRAPLLEQVLKGFFGSNKARAKRFALAFLSTDPGEWLPGGTPAEAEAAAQLEQVRSKLKPLKRKGSWTPEEAHQLRRLESEESDLQQRLRAAGAAAAQ